MMGRVAVMEFLLYSRLISELYCVYVWFDLVFYLSSVIQRVGEDLQLSDLISLTSFSVPINNFIQFDILLLDDLIQKRTTQKRSLYRARQRKNTRSIILLQNDHKMLMEQLLKELCNSCTDTHIHVSYPNFHFGFFSSITHFLLIHFIILALQCHLFRLKHKN